MIGILLVSHGEFSHGLLDSIEMIAGPVENVAYLNLVPGTTVETFSDMVKDKVEELDQGDGVMVFVDILGGTPFNVVGRLKKELPIEIVTGMNLPMLFSAIFDRADSLNLVELAGRTMDEGNRGIKHFHLN